MKSIVGRLDSLLDLGRESLVVSPQKELRVIVVDDDFMIVRLHQNFVESLPGFTVVGTATTGTETLALVEELKPDLLLLDVYLPDQSGIEILGALRSTVQSCDVVLITASKELRVVEEGLRLGIFDYLIKPFNLERLAVSLRKYAQYKSKLEQSTKIDQDTVDNLRRMRVTDSLSPQRSESGIDARTLDKITVCLDSFKGGFSVEEVAVAAGVSRSTARTYLDFMVENGVVEEQLSYGTVGRPRRVFSKIVQ